MPKPDACFVQIYDHVTQNGSGGSIGQRRRRGGGKLRGGVGKHQPVTVRQRLHIMMEGTKRHLTFGACSRRKRRIQINEINLTNGVAPQVYFPNLS